MSLLAVEFIDQLLKQLNDETGVYWRPYEVQSWLNMAQRMAALWKRDSVVEARWVDIEPGPRQVLDSDVVQLFDIVRNASRFGGVVTLVKSSDMPRDWPEWEVAEETDGVEHYIYNPAEPRVFYIYPHYGDETLNQLEAVVGIIPAEIDMYLSTSRLKETPSVTTVAVQDTAMLHDYVMFRACLKQNTHAASARAPMYAQQVMVALGKEAEAKMLADPNKLIAMYGGN